MSNLRIKVRRGTAAEWTTANPTLAAGEIGLETDLLPASPKFKFGDGVTAWNALAYVAGGATVDNAAVNAAILEDAAASRAALGLGSAALSAASAFQPASAVLTALAGVVFAANTFAAQASSGALAAKTITDYSLGLLDDADAPAWRTSLGLGTAALSAAGDFDASGAAAAAQAFAIQRSNHTGTQAQSTVVNLVADLALKADLVGGVIPTAQIPAIAISEFLGTVASQAAMLALVGQKGDWAIRSDTGSTWIITGNDPTQIADWTSVSYPSAPVTSVNGQVGVVVLAAADVGAQPADATLTALAASNWVANSVPIGSGADTVSQVAFAANTFPARASTGDLVAKTISDDALTFLAAASQAAMRAAIGAGTGSGSFSGPGSSTANAIVRFSGTGGATGLDSGITIGDVAGSSVTMASTVGNALVIASTAPAQITTAQAGVHNTITAASAVAGSSVAGAAAGGSVKFQAGIAARLTSGNADSGHYEFLASTGIGTGVSAQVLLYNLGTVSRPALAFDIGGNRAYGFYQTGATIGVSINGVNVASFTNGSLQMGAGIGVVANASTAGALYGFKRQTFALTATGNTVVAHNGATLTNLGAGSAITTTFITAAQGHNYRLVDDNAGGFRWTIKPASGDTIIWIDGTVVTNATGSIVTTARYDRFDVEALDATVWRAYNAVGTFTVTA